MPRLPKPISFTPPDPLKTFPSMNILLFLFASLLIACFSIRADDRPSIRLGVMAGGTLAWELAAMQKQGLTETAPFKLESITLANQQAGRIALQGGAVDVIVADWFWVANMRAENAEYSFYPFSSGGGALVVPAASPIRDLAGLSGKKLGVAGGERDKNWLLLQALGQKRGLGLRQSVVPVYAAPPLLSQQLTEQRLDALLTYWQSAARLEAQGYRKLLSGEDIVSQLGVTEKTPSLGYVFKQSWARQHAATLRSFIETAAAARGRLCNDPQAWEQIRALTEAEDAPTAAAIKQSYCQGHLNQWTPAQLAAADALYRIIHELDPTLTGKAPSLPEGTFWSPEQ